LKSEIKRKVEKIIVDIINDHKKELNIIGANLAGDKILIPLAIETNEDMQEEISKKLSEIILLELDKIRKSGEISNLPILTYVTNPKMISIEI
jgi:hypothetical protein